MYIFKAKQILSNSYKMGSPPVCGESPLALASMV